MLRGISNVIVSLIMLSIMVPVGGIILERVSMAGDSLDLRIDAGDVVNPKISVYFFRNLSSTVVLIYNYGSQDVYIDLLISYDGSVAPVNKVVRPGGFIVVESSLRPPIGVVIDEEIVWGFGG